MNNTSILDGVKSSLGIAKEYKAFDPMLITHINSVLSTLEQIGVGPAGGVFIEDDAVEWAHLLGDDPRLNQVKSYMYLRVRLLFDPPPTSFAIASQEKQAEQMEWRLQVITDPPLVRVPTRPEGYLYGSTIFDTEEVSQ